VTKLILHLVSVGSDEVGSSWRNSWRFMECLESAWVVLGFMDSCSETAKVKTLSMKPARS
jgi:hypothetical protein